MALTFDLDAELRWMQQPEKVSSGKLSCGRYGARVGLECKLTLLDHRGIPATFYFPAFIAELYPDAVISIRSRVSNEIGFHGYSHESVGTPSEKEEREAITRGLLISKVADIETPPYRSPSWDFSPSTLKALGEFGFRFDSSLR